jgi:hypothetical protein
MEMFNKFINLLAMISGGLAFFILFARTVELISYREFKTGVLVVLILLLACSVLNKLNKYNI